MSDFPVKTPFISLENSKRITSLRYFLILLVIFAHNRFVGDRIAETSILFNENAFGYWIKLFFGESISRGVVPLFFMFSSYLQYKKDDPYPRLLKKKARSLLIPYVIWPFINIALILLKMAVNNVVPAIEVFVHERAFLSWGAKEWIKSILGYGNKGGFPLLIQLWFVRDLFVLVVFSPIIKFFVKRFPIEYLIFISFLYFCDIQTDYMSNLAVFFYSLGFFCAEYKIDFFEIADKALWRFLFPLFALIWVYRWTFGVKYSVSEQVMGFAAVFVLIKLSKLFVQNEKFYKVTEYFAGISFFLYCAHYLFLFLNAQVFWINFFPMKNTFWCLAEYFVVWFIVAFVGTGVGILLRKICNPLFVVLNGGRG